MKSFLNRYYGPYNLMFEDYFMQMLTATAPQIVHPLSQFLAYSFQYFDRYLRNKALTNKASQKQSKFVKFHDLDSQLSGPEREIECLPNSPLNKFIVMLPPAHKLQQTMTFSGLRAKLQTKLKMFDSETKHETNVICLNQCYQKGNKSKINQYIR